MHRNFDLVVFVPILVAFLSATGATAAARKGGHFVGGTGSHHKGGHEVGGYGGRGRRSGGRYHVRHHFGSGGIRSGAGSRDDLASASTEGLLMRLTPMPPMYRLGPWHPVPHPHMPFPVDVRSDHGIERLFRQAL